MTNARTAPWKAALELYLQLKSRVVGTHDRQGQIGRSMIAETNKPAVASEFSTRSSQSYELQLVVPGPDQQSARAGCGTC